MGFSFLLKEDNEKTDVVGVWYLVCLSPTNSKAGRLFSKPAGGTTQDRAHLCQQGERERKAYSPTA
jgi:hypothetical protein